MSFTSEQVSKHACPGDMWIIIHGKVYDVSNFVNDHPGGKRILENVIIAVNGK